MANKEGRDRISESRRSKESMREKGSGRERSQCQRKDLGCRTIVEKDRRTHESLPFLGRALADDLPDVIFETLVEHTIGLVENKVGDTRPQSDSTRQRSPHLPVPKTII
jgi:hypothetical protein